MKTIMLIDDDPTMVKLLKTLLEIEGFHSVSWSGASDVLAEVSQQQPDIVLLDINLRGVNGLDVLKQIRADKSLAEMPVLVTSGMDFREASVEAGATDFFMKPYRPDRLVNSIRTHVGPEA